MKLLTELKRRNVFRVALAYLVLAWLLMQVASVLLPTFGAPGWVMRVLVLVLAAGFVVAIVFSWVYELTPEGLKRDHEVHPDASIAHQTAKKLDLAVIVLLVLAIGVATYTHFRTAPVAPATSLAAQGTDARPSLAVLPFVNMSAVAENEYFSDGLTETLLNMLAQVEGLKVTARTSAFAFKGTNKDIREIATTLNVNAVLEGSVQRAGQRVRITAQLIDARDGNHLWSQSYDRTLDDLFTIQDEIAAAVAKELTRSLLGAGSTLPKVGEVGTHDSEAYDLYLRGMEKINLGSYAALPEAERRLKQAVARDPGFADARLALGRTYLQMANTGAIGHPEAAARGLPILAPLLEGEDPDPRALAYDAVLRSRESDEIFRVENRDELIAVTAAALARSPNWIDLYGLAAEVLPEEKAAQALAIIDRGLEIDPLSIALLNERGRKLVDLDRGDEALSVYARMRELAPDSVMGYQGETLLHEEQGRIVDAIYWSTRTMAVDPDDHELPAFVAQYLLVLGLTEEAAPWVRRAELLNAAGSDTQRVLIQYAERTGDTARALALSKEVLRAKRDNRRWVFGIAAIHYMTLMDEAGKLDEALAFIDQVSPGTLKLPPSPPQSEFDLVVQGIVAGYLVRGADPAARKLRAENLRASMLEWAPDLDLEDDEVGAILAEMRGDRADAVKILLGELNDPGNVIWEWRMGLIRDPVLGPVTQVPEVAAAISRMEANYAAQGERYRKLVADGEIKVP
jgi:TolB-like protein/Flp pilus assembly protein TadD